MSYRDWHVGMKVVCVGCDGTPKPAGFWARWQKDWGVVRPDRGAVYTIRDMRMCGDGHLRIRVEEIINPTVAFIDAPPQEPWFFGGAFRPVQPRKADISIFTAMLNGQRQEEPA